MFKMLNNIVNGYRPRLETGIDGSQVTAVLADSGATGSPPIPFLCVLENSEIVQVTNIATDTPSVGLDTITISRGYNDSTAGPHPAGTYLPDAVTAEYIQELNDEVDAIRGLIFYTYGSDGVQQSPANVDLKVQETTTPSMGIIVGAGAGMVDGQPVARMAQYESALFGAPAVNPRIDTVQINQSGGIEFLQGAEAASPVAPAVTTGRIGLAQIYLRVGMTTINNADVAGEGYVLLDLRAFL